MGTEKRQRQKEGRQARIAAAEEAAHRANRRRRYISFVVIAIAVLGVFALINWIAGNHKSKTVSTANSSTTTTSAASTTTLASAKGKNCVAMKGTPPKGAPTVQVQTGPPPTKLVVKDLKVGTGAAAAPADTITVNYIGVACSTGKVFDSSWSRGQPATFGLQQVIKGWTTGLTGMKVGGRRLLGIPSSLGYGAQQAGPDIAPDETLWFVVDLLKVVPPATTTTTGGGSTTTTAPTTTTTK
jgi:FKBP-type peptidyl-prolyl cis-trans isomerase